MIRKITRKNLLKTALIATASLSTVMVWSAEKLTVRLDFSPWGVHAAMHLANEKGWFTDAGLEVEVIDGKGTNNTIQLIASGQGDVGQVQLGPMAVAKGKGMPLKSFAGWARKSDLAVLVARDSGINTVADLKGKKGVSFSASPWVPYINQFLKNGGTSRDEFDISMVAPASMMGVYVQGKADGALTVAPFGLPLVETTRPAKAILSADYGVAFPSYGLMATEDTLKEKASALSTLAKVQQKAWVYIFDGHVDEAVAAIQAQRPKANFSAAVLKGQIESYRDFFNTRNTIGKPLGWQAEQDWQDAIDAMVGAGLIAKGVKPSDFYTNDLLD